MKKLLFVVAVLVGLSLFGVAQARVTSVRGYVKRSTGTYVAPHYKTTPNRTRLDNFSTKGNSNPFTGKKGYVSPVKYRY